MGDVSNVGKAERAVPPEFEDALIRLKPGEFSEVVSTRLGFHVFWRLD